MSFAIVSAAQMIELDPELFTATSHLILLKKGATRLPNSVKRIRVLSGCAWLSLGGQDVIVHRGEEMVLASDKFGVVVSPANKTPLLLAYDEA